MTPMQMAAIENEAARRSWGMVVEGSPVNNKSAAPVYVRIKPLIGTGITNAEAARRLGCSPPSITYALNKLGAKL